MDILTKDKLIPSNIGKLFVTSASLRSYMLSLDYLQAELCELVSLGKPETSKLITLPKGKALGTSPETFLAEDTEVIALVPESPTILSFYQGRNKSRVRVKLFAHLSAKEVESLIPSEAFKLAHPTSKKEQEELDLFRTLDSMGLF